MGSKTSISLSGYKKGIKSHGDISSQDFSPEKRVEDTLICKGYLKEKRLEVVK